MNQQVVLFFTLLGAFVFRHTLYGRTRDFITPWAFAYTFVVACVLGTMENGSGVFHFFMTALNFIPVMIVCSNFTRADSGRNPVWVVFLTYYCYMILISFTGYYPVNGSTYFLQIFMNSFLNGYCMARWCCKTEGALQKLLVPMLLVSVVCVLYYVQNLGALSANKVDDYGRVLLGELNDEGKNMFNPNYVALNLCSLLPFALLAFQWVGKRWKIFKWISLGCVLLLVLVLVRTGSRNGALGLLPCVWYFFHMSQTGKIKAKYIALGVVAGIVLSIGILMTNKGLDRIRFFDFKGLEMREKNGEGMDAITTGRWSMYERSLENMSLMQKIVGAGAALTNTTYEGERIFRFKGGNAHSMYMTVFHRTGFVGAAIFLCLIIRFFMQRKKIGRVRANIAVLCFSVWVMTGVGESLGMLGGLPAILAGMGMGFLSLKPAINSEFGEMSPWQDSNFRW